MKGVDGFYPLLTFELRGYEELVHLQKRAKLVRDLHSFDRGVWNARDTWVLREIRRNTLGVEAYFIVFVTNLEWQVG